MGQKQILQFLTTVRAEKNLVILDTCYAAALTKDTWWRGVTEKTAIARLINATGRAFLYASSDTKMAVDGYQGHGVFTYVLLEGLRGQADIEGNRDGEISVVELAMFASHKVPMITKQHWDREQFPMHDLRGMSFPIGTR